MKTNKIYIAKKDSWFKEGTKCQLLEDYKEAGGLYRGIYIVGKNEKYNIFWHNQGYKEGDEVIMNEVCSHNEFDVKQLKKLIKLSSSHYVIVDDSKIDTDDYYVSLDDSYGPSKYVLYVLSSGLNGLSPMRVTHSTHALETMHVDGHISCTEFCYDKIKPIDLSEVTELTARVDNWERAKEIFEREESRQPNINDNRDLSAVAAIHLGLEDNKEKMFTKNDLVRVELCYLRQGDRDIKYKGQIVQRIMNEKISGPNSWDIEIVEDKIKLI